MNTCRRMSIVTVAVLLSISVLGVSPHAQKPTPIAVFKDAGCGCCSVWVEHLRRNGFAPTQTNQNPSQMAATKDKHRVPRQARSCHTGIVEGYVIEGHVPAAEVRRLLKMRPAGVIGLTVPGMPIGSPGMEGPNARAYDVLAFDKQGKTTVFSTQHPR
jgi:hypothetical protein